MTTATNIQEQEELLTALYCRLSVDDIKEDDAENESNSIKNQKIILEDYCRKNGITNYRFFVDDGISGTTFNRPDFMRMEEMVEAGLIGRIIVKDLSRFGREQVEMGRLTQMVYPSLGVTFISLQENVNSETGSGMEMMPFYNIFNEWYASQTSQKIRQVWKTKSEHGERVGTTVAYGYKKSETNKKQWVIDEPAAEVVRKIYALCLNGMGPLQISKQLEKEKIPVPYIYYDSIGKKRRQQIIENPYKWNMNTITGILENRQYTGCTVNFKSTSVSYKVHKRIFNSEEEQQIIPNTQEAIIPEEDWLKVQEIRQNRIRHTATGKTSKFSGLLYCADCGAKLHYCAAKSIKPEREYYRCASYKDGRGKCTVHYIRNVVLEKIVLEAISDFIDFVRCYEPIFMYMLAKKNDAIRQSEYSKLRQFVSSGEKRIEELDRLIESLYEDKVLGTLEDSRFQRMMKKYEKEQSDLLSEVEKVKAELETAEQKKVDLQLLLKTVRDMTEVKELTSGLVHSLIERIEVHNSEKTDGKKHVKVDIYFSVIGMMNIPDEKEIQAMMKDIQKKPQKYRYVA